MKKAQGTLELGEPMEYMAILSLIGYRKRGKSQAQMGAAKMRFDGPLAAVSPTCYPHNSPVSFFQLRDADWPEVTH